MKPSTYCKNCGAYIPDGKKKCLACGFPVDVPPLYGDPNKVETTSFQETMPEVLSIPDDDENDIPMTTLDDKMLNITFHDNYYAPVLKVANEVLQNIKQSDPKKQEPKPDIDLDDLMEKTFLTVKIDGKVSRFYFGDRPIIRVDGLKTLCHTRIDGHIVIDTIKRIIDFRLLEE